MMFNKKMLGSCCVGLALFLSGEGFCAQKEVTYTVGETGREAKITVADVEAGIKAFKAVKDWEAKKEKLSSYWDMYTAAYVMAKKGVEVGDVKSGMTAEQILELTDWEIYTAVEAIPGGQELYFAIYDGVYNGGKSVVVEGMGDDGDDEISTEDDLDDVGHSEVEMHGGSQDDAVFNCRIAAEDFLKALKTSLKEVGKDIKEFKLSDEQHRLLEGENDEDLKDILGNGFDAAYHALSYLEEYYAEKVLPRPVSLEKLRDKYFSLIAAAAETNKKMTKASETIRDLQKKNIELAKGQKVGAYTVTPVVGRGLSNDVLLQGGFQLKPNELNGVATAGRGIVSDVVSIDKVGVYNKDKFELLEKGKEGKYNTSTEDKFVKQNHAVYDTTTHALYDTTTEDKFVKQNHEVINTTTHVKADIALAANIRKLNDGQHELVNTAHKNAELARKEMLAKVEGLKQSTVVIGIDTGNAVFGNRKNAQAAARGEVDAIFDVNGGGSNEIAKITPVFGGIDLTKLEAGDINVLNAIATKFLSGDWQNFADTTGVKDATLKGILDTAITVNVNDAAVANLITAEFGSLPNVAPSADAVRRDLLIATLAGKDANAIKGSIDD